MPDPNRQIPRTPRAGTSAVTGLSRSSIYALEGSNLFPRRLKLGIRSVGWLESEVRACLRARGAAGITCIRRNGALPEPLIFATGPEAGICQSAAPSVPHDRRGQIWGHLFGEIHFFPYLSIYWDRNLRDPATNSAGLVDNVWPSNTAFGGSGGRRVDLARSAGNSRRWPSPPPDRDVVGRCPPVPAPPAGLHRRHAFYEPNVSKAHI
jgi:prophage regulatory protein